jgi:hypothetical protein
MFGKPVATKDMVDVALMDVLFECYLDWREACQEVAQTYDDWCSAVSGDRGKAFAAYRCALELEQDASEVCAEVVAAAIDGEVLGRARFA